MSRHRLKVMGSLVVVTAAAAATILMPNLASAAAPSQQAVTAPSVQGEEHLAQLREFATADRRGTFYTLDPAEAGRAERKYGFKPKDDAKGIRMFDEQVEGTVPVHRLRKKSGHQSYLLSVSKEEIKKLEGKFEDEGVMGYVWNGPRDGAMPLVRYSKNSDWRVSRANRADLVAAGYGVDGVMGYVPQG